MEDEAAEIELVRPLPNLRTDTRLTGPTRVRTKSQQNASDIAADDLHSH